MNWKEFKPDTLFSIGSDLLFAYLDSDNEWQYVKGKANLTGVQFDGPFMPFSRYCIIEEPKN